MKTGIPLPHHFVPPPPTMRFSYPPKTELVDSRFEDELKIAKDDLEESWSRLEGDDEPLDEEVQRLTQDDWSPGPSLARRLLRRLKRSS